MTVPHLQPDLPSPRCGYFQFLQGRAYRTQLTLIALADIQTHSWWHVFTTLCLHSMGLTLEMCWRFTRGEKNRVRVIPFLITSSKGGGGSKIE
jgi:hypothetical protein